MSIRVLAVDGGRRACDLRVRGDETSPTILPGAPFSTTDIRVGTGAEAAAGRRATVNYSGWLYDPVAPENKGRQFDSSTVPGRTPFMLTVGAGQVIRGFDMGVTGMKVGGRRTLTIPPDMAYGAEGLGELIPPNATLIFDVELVGIK